MSNPEYAGYDIEDPRPIAAKARYTYFLPSAEEVAAVAAGDLVKLSFEYTHATEKWGGERMWVIVETSSGSLLRGTLDNNPDEPTSPLKAGDLLTFERHQILAIQWADPSTAPAPGPVREYWGRCLVDNCVLDGTEPVEYLYREEPDLADEGDTYPDSGWRIRGRMGDASDAEIEAREARYVALGAVLNRDDSWLHLIDAPVGSRFMRDFEQGTYQAKS
jgi:hypothetical protein